MNTTVSTIESYEENLKVNYVQVSVLVTIMILIITGNMIVMITIRSVRSFQLSTKLFVISLCIADLSIGAICVPMRLNEVFIAPWTRDVNWCKLSIAINILNLLASLINLIAMSTERLFYLNRPMKYKVYMTEKKALAVVISIWIFVFATSFMPIFSGIAIQDGATKDKSHYYCKYATTLKREYLITMCVIYILPSGVFALVYLKILILIKSHSKRIKRDATYHTRTIRTVHQRETRATTLLISLTGAFYLCWVPSIIGIYLSINQGEKITQSFIFILITMVYSNSFINSLLFTIMIPECRKTIKKWTFRTRNKEISFPMKSLHKAIV